MQDQTVRASEAEGLYSRAIALGLERLGLIPSRTPKLSLAITLALVVLAVLGIERIKVDDSLSQLFRSNSPAFRQYEEVSREFPSSEYNVLVVVSGAKLLERESIEKLRSLVTDLQLMDGTRGVISMFSARKPSPSGGLPPPLFPEYLPQGVDYQRLIERVTTMSSSAASFCRTTAGLPWSSSRSNPSSSTATGCGRPSRTSRRRWTRTSRARD